MANVWYMGEANVREVFGQSFNIWNGWSVPESNFTGAELAILNQDSGFLLGQTGPRTEPAPPAVGGVSDPAYPYFTAIKEMYDDFKANYAPGAEAVISDNSILPIKLKALATTPSASLWYRGDGNWAAPPNTTYSVMSLAELQAGSATTSRVVNALILRQMLYWAITGDSTVAPGAFGQTLAKAANQAAARTALGTDLVDNTSDANKPVSTAQLAAIQGRVPKVGAASRVYITDASSADTSLPYSSTAATANSVAVRDANGQIVVINTPTATNHAASKAYADTKAPLASPTFTGTVSGVTKAHVGLANVDNTADSAKPISTAQQSALDLKANVTALAGYAPIVNGKIPEAYIPAVALTEFLGAVGSQAAMLALVGQKGDWATRTDLSTDWQIIGDDPTQLSSWRERTYPAGGGAVSSVAGRTGAVTLTSADLTDGTTVGRGIFKAADATAAKAFLALVKGDVGLGNVDNTADSAKPVSTAQQTALNAKAPLASPTFTGTVSGITAAMVGLGNVNNTADSAKPVSSAQQTALDAKVDKLTGLTARVLTIDTSGVYTSLAYSAAGNGANTFALRDANGRVKMADPAGTNDGANYQWTQAQIAAAQLTLANAQTAAYTLALADATKAVEVTSASAVNVTVPPNSAIAFPVGTTIDILQAGAGAVTLVPGAGVTLRTPASLVSRAQWSTLSLRKRATDEWVVSGDMV